VKTRLLAVLGAVAVVAAACGGDDGVIAAPDDTPEGEGRTPIRVVASFYPLAEAAERVGGGRVTVTNLTPAGAEPHDLDIDPRQVESIHTADVVLVMGRGFQPGVEGAADGADGLVVELLDELPIPQGEVPEHSHGDDGHEDGHRHGEDDDHGDDDHDDGRRHDALDPHVWLDPTQMGAIVAEVAAALGEIEPDGAGTFAANAEAFDAELADLDDRYTAALADCRHDLIVVQHEAFGWMTDRYGLRQEGIAGLSPEQEPDPRRLAELIDLVDREGIDVVFTETLVSPRIAETLAREAGVATLTLNPIEGLTDEQKAAGERYTSIMEANLENLTEALDCR
jgi:zinc transport system substrate-binding protein